MQVDYLIVGQGIAGSMLAYSLLERGKSVLVVDRGAATSTSAVSLAMLNPVLGRRLNLAWRGEVLLPYAKKMYGRLEKKFDRRFLRELNVVRLFADERQRKRWLKQQTIPDIQKFVVCELNGDEYPDLLDFAHGGVEFTGAFCLDAAALLQALRADLRTRGVLTEQRLLHTDLQLTANGAVWQDVAAGEVVFCEGHHSARNPWFSWLPWTLSKGEWLRVRIPELEIDKLINPNFFIVPEGDCVYRLGATFDWDRSDTVLSEDGRDQLLKKLARVVRHPVEVLEQFAGIRPALRDRKPVMGCHPAHGQLAIFGGMGGKGFSFSPYYADRFAGTLAGDCAIDPEVDIRRFAHLPAARGKSKQNKPGQR